MKKVKASSPSVKKDQMYSKSIIEAPILRYSNPDTLMISEKDASITSILVAESLAS